MEKIIDDLTGRGWSVQEDYFPPDLIAELQRDLELNRAAMTQAGIGRGENLKVRSEVRNDVTLWLDGQSGAQNEYLRLLDAVRIDLNRALFLGLHSIEAHYALYEPGGFYKKHVDSLKGQRNRVVSTVTYLTKGWRAEDGGHLVLYDAAGHELTRILPLSGTLVIFMSEDIPHEVLPPARARCSIAGWFRCNP
ncbi:MAG: SM-20-related protein [Micavibrio sp.]|nr:SM-20-related protein [Micavibrio sp.]